MKTAFVVYNINYFLAGVIIVYMTHHDNNYLARQTMTTHIKIGGKFASLFVIIYCMIRYTTKANNTATVWCVRTVRAG